MRGVQALREHRRLGLVVGHEGGQRRLVEGQVSRRERPGDQHAHAIAAREDMLETHGRLADLVQWMGESIAA